MEKQGLVCFLLGVAITLLAVLVFRGGPMSPALADGASSDGVIALSAGENCLCLYDVKNQKLAIYDVAKGERLLRLIGARNTRYDFSVREDLINPKGFSYSDMEKKYKKGE